MRYPNSNKTYQNKVSHANRGMALEELINDANNYYIENDIALIYKKPTPIGIVSVNNDIGSKMITKAFFKEPSTLDYSGIYKGKYIEFDAKQTKSLSSFPLSNISPHQLEHMQKVIQHQGITFLIIEIVSNYYLLDGRSIFQFMGNNKRKSIPLNYIKNNGYKINGFKNIRLNYIEMVDKILEALNEKVEL